MTWPVVIAAGWTTATLILTTILLLDERDARRSRRAQSIPGWVNPPTLTVVPDEPHVADVIPFPAPDHGRQGGAAS